MASEKVGDLINGVRITAMGKHYSMTKEGPLEYVWVRTENAA